MDLQVSDFLVTSFLSEIVNMPRFDQRISDLLDLEDISTDENLIEQDDGKENCPESIVDSISKQNKTLPSLSYLKFDQQKEEQVKSSKSRSRGDEKRKDDCRLDANTGDTVSHYDESCVVRCGYMPPPTKICRQLSDAPDIELDCNKKPEDKSSIRNKLRFKADLNAAMPALESVFCSTQAFENCVKSVMDVNLTSGQFLQTTEIASVLSGSFQSCKDEILPQLSIFTKFDHFKGLNASHKYHEEADTNDVIQRLVRAQAKHCSETPKPGSEKWITFRKQQENEFRQKQSMPKTDLQSIIKTMANNSIICFETVVRESTMFCKNIPGFNDLDLEDKITLIKESRQETQIPSLIRSYHREMKIAAPVPGYNFVVDDVIFLMPDTAEDMFECVRVHSQRDIWSTITDEEEALLKAIVFTDSDRCVALKNRDKVTRLHHQMISCLVNLLETTFKDDAPARKREIDYMLMTCRYFSVSFHNYMKKKLLQVPGHAQNQTLNEVML